MTRAFEIEYKLPENLWQELLARLKMVTFKKYSTLIGTETDCYIARPFEDPMALHSVDDGDIINKIRNLFSDELSYGGAGFFRFAPHSSIFPHIDDHEKRNTVIAWRITPPTSDFAPLLFYNENGDIIASVPYSEYPLAFSGLRPHGVINNQYTRVSFQLCFYDDISKVRELYLQDKLMRT
jgi:hypothetical protein